MTFSPFNPNVPIPNNPFYSPESAYLYGPTGPLIVGSGFSINNITGTLDISGGGSGAPTILPGVGISVVSGIGTVTIANTGILTLTAGSGIRVSGSGSNLTITNTAPAPSVIGTVSSVSTGTGLVGGPITSTGTISLAPVGTVAPGTYTNATITVDIYGRVTFAAPGSGLGSLLQATAPLSVNASIPQTISINNASTGASGAVQLNSSTNSTSTTQAATPSAVKTAFDLATTATTNSATALSASTSAVTTAGNAQITANNALSTAIAAQTSANTAQTTANSALVTGFAAQVTANAAIPCSSFTFKGQVLAATGPSTFVALNSGVNGQVLVACSTCASGLTWLSQPSVPGTVTSVATGIGLTGGTITTTGTIALSTSGVSAGTFTNATVAVDTFGRVTAASTGAPSIPNACIIGKGALVTGLGVNTPVALPVGADNRVLTACSACPSGLTWAPGGGGGSGSVTSVATGTGLTGGPITSTGTITLANTAVTPGAYTSANITIDAQGRITAAANGSAGGVGTVTSITAGTGLTGGTITAAGTIGLANTAVSAGAYTYGSFTVDAQGRLTAASSGVAPLTALTGTSPIAVTAGTSPVVSITASSTTASGAVQLYNDVNSTSTALALTAAQGKVLQDQITSLVLTGTIELAGTIDAATGLLVSVTSKGTIDGYVIGAVLPAASVTTNNSYVIVTNPGTLTPPGGSATVATRGDYFLVSESSLGVYAWTFLNVGFDAPAATTSVAGIVCLSTNALAQTGTDATTALTPAAATSAFIPKTCITAKGALISGTAASTPTALTVGTDGQALIACAACVTGLTWVAVSSGLATPTVAGSVLGCTTVLNSALGCNALVCNTTGSCNTANGVNALYCNTTGSNNTANGGSALQNNTTGIQNTANGVCALRANTTGCFNTANGVQALVSNTTGNSNTANGVQALLNNTTGGNNTANGVQALLNNTTGGCNTADGASALLCNTTGPYNTANGVNALCLNTTGRGNTAVGSLAGCGITSGNQNLALGCGVQVTSPTASCQLAIGFSFTENWLTGDSSKNIKPGAGIRDCTNSTGTIGQVLMSNGTNAICWGASAGGSAATPTVAGLIKGCTADNALQNTALGCNALLAVPTGCFNTALGFCAGPAITTACCNVVVGNIAGLAITTGCSNTLFGNASGCQIDIGEHNVGIGTDALNSVTSGSDNLGIGFASGYNITTGSENVAIGSLVQVASGIGSCQLAIGFSATCNWLTGDSTKAIRPGAGIADCASSTGTAGQVLMSNGANAICWGAVVPIVSMPWVLAGTNKSVGLGATTTAPVPGTTLVDAVYYRQLDVREWEVSYIFSATGTWVNAGSGDYLFTLPNGLRFDTTLPFQGVFQSNVGVASQTNIFYTLKGPCSGSTSFSNGSNSSLYNTPGVIIWDATRWRFMTTDFNTAALRAIGSAYYGGNASAQWNMRFQFTSL